MKEEERTTIMSPLETSIFPSSRIAQLGVGQLEIRAHAFPASGAQEIAFSHEITLQDASKGIEGWGEEIFKGTLKDLIEFVKEAKDGSSHRTDARKRNKSNKSV